MDRIYLNKLDLEYFKKCIDEIIDDYNTEDGDPVYIIDGLETLYNQVAGLRDAFFIFSIDKIEELLIPIKAVIEKQKELLELE